MSIFGILGGIALGIGAAIAGAVICDMLTAEEERKQDRMTEQYESYCRDRKEQYEQTERSLRESYNSLEASYEDSYESEFQKRVDSLKKHNRPYIDSIKKDLDERRSSVLEKISQLQEVLTQWNTIKDDAQGTMLRIKSLKNTILSIEEAYYKLKAYLVYLDRYESNMDYCFERNGDIPAPFSMTLPKYYPYPGKVFYLKREDFIERNGRLVYNVPDEKNLSLFLVSGEEKLFRNSSMDVLPFMVCYFKLENKPANNISIAKGLVKESAEGFQGISAEVTEVLKQGINLTVEGQRLFLPRKGLADPHKGLPRGSSVVVYLTSYDFALTKTPQVSEKQEDSISLAQFRNIGMVMTGDEQKKLYDMLSGNNWLNLDDEWRIGPDTTRIEKTDIPYKYVKLQLGDYYGYLAEMVSVGKAAEGKMFLRFIRILDKSEFMSFTDVFAAANVSIECYSTDFIKNDELTKECGFLYTYLSGEFNLQRKMLMDSPMALYLKKWRELNNRLIDVLKYKDRITLEVESWDTLRKITYLMVPLSKELKKFVCRDTSAFRPIWLLCFPDGKKDTYLKCHVEIEEENMLYVSVRDFDPKVLNGLDFRVDLILLTNVTAERLQAEAYDDFREGLVSNISLKETILQMSVLEYKDTGNRIINLYNKNIDNNERQYRAVNRAFSCEDFFMVQGPPGTGKTTVIKELIMQQLHLDPSSKILIVSQANVAVDNVLRGIKALCHTEACVSEEQLIRCGTDDKIASDIKELSFKGRLDKYIEKIKTTSSENPELRKKWLDLISDKKDFVGECLLRGYQIVGATCVGFASRNIGLTGMEFDLVIIDEAGKALPGELLIPINRAKKLIMIGDHKQLPPVINPEMYQNGSVQTDDIIEENERPVFFSRSFFERMWDDCPDTNKCMLDTQFRMAPAVSGLVNIFYDGRLKDGHNCGKKIPVAFDSHLVVLDMKEERDYYEKQQKASGPYNVKEQHVVIELVRKLRPIYPEEKRIVVITPYKKQKKMLIDMVKNNGLKNVWVNTIDAFQGDEEDVVVYCMTRAKHKTIYFSDAARLNVAFSRARNLLIIIGSMDYLKSYGEDHILYKVCEYLNQYGRIIPYSDFASDDFQAVNPTYWACRIHKEKEEPENKTTVVHQAVFDTPKQPPTAEKCASCGNELLENEHILCMSCLNSADQFTCRKCGQRFRFPRYLRYVKNIQPPSLCEKCSEVTCSCCGITFRADKPFVQELKDQNKPIYCLECRNDIELHCAYCQNTFTIKRYRYQEMVRKAQKIYCSDCMENVDVFCNSCGVKHQIRKYYLKTLQTDGKKVYCAKCQEQINASCDRCGNTFQMRVWMYNDLRQRGKGCLCSNCRTKKYR